MVSLLRAENYCWLLSCWFAHLSAFKVKAGAGWFAPFNPRHWHSSLLCCSQVHVPSRLLCILDGLSSPQQNHWGAGRLTEPWLCLWAITNFSPSTKGLPCGSCPALNSGTACKVNCCPTQLFTSAIYILPVTIRIIRASAAWWCSLRPADFPFN